jgi:RNA polymerase sigma factor (sigma-70 family)
VSQGSANIPPRYSKISLCFQYCAPSEHRSVLISSRDFAAVYDEHVWRVYGFFAYRMRSRADAEDLTQQTFERALRSWSRYDPSRAAIATWLLVIARNLLVDHHRADRSARQQPLDEVDGGHLALVAPTIAPDLGIDPNLERALACLAPRDREVVALRFGGELSGPEIATATGLSLANVQQILSRSLRRMRAAMDEATTIRGDAHEARRLAKGEKG